MVRRHFPLAVFLADPVPEIDIVNKYLYCVMDCGMSFDSSKILKDLKEIGLKPNIVGVITL